MMRGTAISVRNVGKKFRLFTAPVDRLKEALHLSGKTYHREFWALRDVSLNVAQGETLGLMGRNGAGKTTLLEILCGVTEPTEGAFEVNGTLSALLALGAGFNPEFTGRQNLFANAPLFGLSRAQMGARLPEIEAFADIGDYIDQPVRTYSSGMFVRLAFAMSICVDPDILIIDEALAVGDAAFQDKCYRRLREFKAAGKTFILVSHAAEMIAELCDRVVILEQGGVDFIGPPREALIRYGALLFGDSVGQTLDARALRQAIETPSPVSVSAHESPVVREFLSLPADVDRCGQRFGYNAGEVRSGDRRALIVDYLLLVDGAPVAVSAPFGAETELYLKVRFDAPVEHPRVALSFQTPQGLRLYGSNTDMQLVKLPAGAAGDVQVFRIVFRNILGPGHYFLSLWVMENRAADAARLDVRESAIELVVGGMVSFNGYVDLNIGIDKVT